MKFLVPLVLAFAGIGAGVGAGVALRPGPGTPETEAHGAVDSAGAHGGEKPVAKPGAKAGDHGGGHGSDGGPEFVELKAQFIVPVLESARVRSLVILSIDLEVGLGQSEAIHRYEPKIRDAFLTVLFDHANTGGFEGNFTSNKAMDSLRVALREAGQRAVGEQMLTDVLITNIIRQDT